jgi:hypothetical protein
MWPPKRRDHRQVRWPRSEPQNDRAVSVDEVNPARAAAWSGSVFRARRVDRDTPSAHCSAFGALAGPRIWNSYKAGQQSLVPRVWGHRALLDDIRPGPEAATREPPAPRRLYCAMSRLPLCAVLSLTALAPAAGPARGRSCSCSDGGTISGKGASSTSLAEYKSGAILGEELVAAVPEIKDVAEVRVEQIANVSSTDITVAHWLTLANRINRIFETEPRATGVVITHGTNTIEETAYS